MQKKLEIYDPHFFLQVHFRCFLNYLYRLIILKKDLSLSKRFDKFGRFSIQQYYCHVEIPFSFFNKMVNKLDFLKNVNLY